MMEPVVPEMGLGLFCHFWCFLICRERGFSRLPVFCAAGFPLAEQGLKAFRNFRGQHGVLR
jgi:hypothetical protein